jgi:hypothetical protein
VNSVLGTGYKSQCPFKRYGKRLIEDSSIADQSTKQEIISTDEIGK